MTSENGIGLSMIKFPKTFIAFNWEMKKMKCDRCTCETLVECHGHFQCSQCGSIVEECCQGENTFHSPPDPCDSKDDKDIPN